MFEILIKDFCFFIATQPFLSEIESRSNGTYPASFFFDPIKTSSAKIARYTTLYSLVLIYRLQIINLSG